jgi:hypothetical protein
MKMMFTALVVAAVLLPTGAFSQQGQGRSVGAVGGNSAKQAACRAQSFEMNRRPGASGGSGGSNMAAARAQRQAAYQQCMAQ